MEKLSRKEAIERGSMTYFTGKPCRNGHRAYRYTSSGACSKCIAEYKEWEKAYIKKRRAEAESRGET